MKNIEVSDYLHFQPVDREEDITIGWNRFFPTIFILNRFARELLEAVKNKKKIDHNEETQRFFKELFKYKFLYDTEKDPSKDDFTAMIENQVERAGKESTVFFKQKKAYGAVTIFNDECNLACPYCVNQYKRKPPGPPVKQKNSPAGRWEIVSGCLDQYVSQQLKQEQGQDSAREPKPVNLYFNGGEILLEWHLIKKIVQWLKERYKSIKFELGVNTNMTLMTEEIAEFLVQHNFEVSISIDGYGGAHNRTRKYRDNKGSFADILRGLEIYRKFAKKNPITVFQGTIDDIGHFRPEKVYEMERHGFLQARLAPNLLNISEEDALKKAGTMGKFLELNDKNRFQVTELFFSNAKNRINQDNYCFSFNCQGLSVLSPLKLHINVSTLQASLLCGYVHDAWLSLENAAYDIYNPKLFQRAYRFIKKRAEAIKKYCFDCHLVGLCSGGCIYTGLDNENQLNRAACAYQKKLWAIYIQKVYNDRKKS